MSLLAQLGPAMREKGEKSFPQVKAQQQLQVLDKGTEFEQSLV